MHQDIPTITSSASPIIPLQSNSLHDLAVLIHFGSCLQKARQPGLFQSPDSSEDVTQLALVEFLVVLQDAWGIELQRDYAT